jgi:hypothetical protein
MRGALLARRQIKQRWLRIHNKLQANRLDALYQGDAQFRKDIEREAAVGDTHFGAALWTTEMFRYFTDARRGQVRAGGNPVVIVPGCLASTLDDDNSNRRIWLNPLELAGKRFLQLRLARYDGCEHDADPNVQIEATDYFRWMYHTLHQQLRSHGFASEVHPYDWRKSVDHESSAECLKKRIVALHKKSKRRVHIVAHSLGGLVSRRAVQCLCDEIGEPNAKKVVGRIVLLGPAVSGTFAAALGIAGAFEELPFMKLFPGPTNYALRRFVRPTTKSWTALYQLLPWDPCIVPSLNTNDVRDPKFWIFPIDRSRLSFALPPGAPAWASTINTQSFHQRTTVILGFHPDCPTASGVHWYRKRLKAEYDPGLLGDGFMLHVCSVLPCTNAYVACGIDHIRLPMAPQVIEAVVKLVGGSTDVDLCPYDPNKVPCRSLRSAGARSKFSGQRRAATPARRS